MTNNTPLTIPQAKGFKDPLGIKTIKERVVTLSLPQRKANMGVKPTDIDHTGLLSYEEFERICDYSLTHKQHTSDGGRSYKIYEFDIRPRADEATFLNSVYVYGQRYAVENGWGWWSTASNTGYKLHRPTWLSRLWRKLTT